MLKQTAVRVLNHLLAAAPWARERLHPFAGQHVRLEGGPLSLVLCITSAGDFAAATGEAAPDVTITLPSDAPALLLTDRSRLMSGARLTGAADVAEALGFVFRHLRWDAEDDLSRWVGDIAARRLVQGGQAVARWQADALHRTAENLADYAAEEAALLVRSRDMTRFANDVAALRDDLARLEKRLQRLG